MSSPQKSLTAMGKVVAGLLVVLGLVLAIRRRPDPPQRPFVAPSTAPAPSAVTTSSAAYLEAEIIPETWLPTPPASSPRTAPPPPADGLVRLATGHWVAEGGARVHVDAPRPARGRKPRYHLVLEREDKSGFGCDFDELHEGADLSGYDVTYRCWCGGEAKARQRSVLGLRVDGRTLHVGILVDEKLVVTQAFDRRDRSP